MGLAVPPPPEARSLVAFLCFFTPRLPPRSGLCPPASPSRCLGKVPPAGSAQTSRSAPTGGAQPHAPSKAASWKAGPTRAAARKGVFQGRGPGEEPPDCPAPAPRSAEAGGHGLSMTCSNARHHASALCAFFLPSPPEGDARPSVFIWAWPCEEFGPQATWVSVVPPTLLLPTLRALLQDIKRKCNFQHFGLF